MKRKGINYQKIQGLNHQGELNHQVDWEKDQAIVDQFPNEATIKDMREASMPENNFFKNHTDEKIKKTYMRFNALMDLMYETLELPRDATMETFAFRVRDICLAIRDK